MTKCPKCDNEHINTEKGEQELIGDSICYSCGYQGPTAEFTFPMDKPKAKTPQQTREELLNTLYYRVIEQINEKSKEHPTGADESVLMQTLIEINLMSHKALAGDFSDVKNCKKRERKPDNLTAKDFMDNVAKNALGFRG